MQLSKTRKAIKQQKAIKQREQRREAEAKARKQAQEASKRNKLRQTLVPIWEHLELSKALEEIKALLWPQSDYYISSRSLLSSSIAQYIYYYEYEHDGCDGFTGKKVYVLTIYLYEDKIQICFGRDREPCKIIQGEALTTPIRFYEELDKIIYERYV